MNKARNVTLPSKKKPAGAAIVTPHDTEHRANKKLMAFTVVAATLLICVAVIGSKIYQQRAAENERATTTRNLNDVAADLHKVYISLKSELPNVVESKFQNDCTMSYAGSFSKNYSCGPMFRIFNQNVIDNNLKELRESAITRLGVFGSYLNTGDGQTSNNYSYSNYQFIHSNGQKCKVDVTTYNNASELQGDTGVSGDGWAMPVEVDDIYCTKNLPYSAALENSWAQ